MRRQKLTKMGAIITVAFMCLFIMQTAFAQSVKVGVVLPLHNVNGDGLRMIEYYRGVLLAVDSLKQEGQNVEITAVNAHADSAMAKVLDNENLKACDLIFGPLYSVQVPELSNFVKANNQKLVIPFSINTPEINTNPNIFQIYQSPEWFEPLVVENFMNLSFKDADCQVVIIDCNDTTNFKKPTFTATLKNFCEKNGVKYRITNVKQTDKAFAKAFNKKKNNLVVLNSASSPKMLEVFEKMKGVYDKYDNKIVIKYLGYTEWLMYQQYQYDNFCKNNVYIPSYFYYNAADKRVTDLENKYRFWFRQDVISALPRFVLTGFDQAYYFIKGFAKYGKAFTGTKQQTVNNALQTPLHFVKTANGGYKNNDVMFIHYRSDKAVELINY